MRKGKGVVHDAYTGLFQRHPADSNGLWAEVEGCVAGERGMLIREDSTLDKPYASKMALVSNHGGYSSLDNRIFSWEIRLHFSANLSNIFFCNALRPRPQAVKRRCNVLFALGYRLLDTLHNLFNKLNPVQRREVGSCGEYIVPINRFICHDPCTSISCFANYIAGLNGGPALRQILTAMPSRCTPAAPHCTITCRVQYGVAECPPRRGVKTTIFF